MSQIHGYTRVSTFKQIKGNSLVEQEESILNKYKDAIIYKEQYSAKSTDRPILNQLVSIMKNGDTLVVTKLDRLARNTVEGINIIQELFKKNISVHVLNVGLLENTTMGKFFITTMLAVAEMERSTIMERTQAGKEIARTKEGFKDGRPKKFTEHQLESAVALLKDKTYSEVVKLTNISKSTLIREVKRLKEIEALNDGGIEKWEKGKQN